MFAGHSFEKAKQWAWANAKADRRPRYLFIDTGGNYQIEDAPPRSSWAGVHSYWEVHPSG